MLQYIFYSYTCNRFLKIYSDSGVSVGRGGYEKNMCSVADYAIWLSDNIVLSTNCVMTFIKGQTKTRFLHI